jgi:nitrogen fixation protein FixH
MVVGVLGLTVAGNIWVAVLAARDPSAAIEENYYDKAVAFDSRLALATRAARLGWQVAVTASPMGADGVTLTPRVLDRAGNPIPGLRVTVTARHVARAADPFTGSGTLDANGAASVTLPMHRVGLWDVQIDAWRAGERVSKTQRLDLGEPGVVHPS